ncbi:two-component system, CitB family, sensor histidine kinase CitS [Terribacillus halophilus]|uniref:histidine kinase n=1 Tax=Terribacillus halophilus TaxID=361279 RepID=A0A1G6IR92_9BACI|nr:sensor histidine kinase [Terribacillus halophilus]SDC09029.1 two-component system, CitB family, sensor histidine kinase CitS [Terribacillus halophilus]
MKNLLRVSLQVKILGLVIFLLLLVLSLVTIMIAYMESNKDVENAENMALQTAKTVSYMPVIQEAFIQTSHPEEINYVSEQIREEVGASTIKIVARSGEAVGISGVGSPIRSADFYRAVVFGSNYILHTGEGDDEILKGIAPIIVDYGEYKRLEGAVIAEFQMKDIHNEVAADIKKIIMASSAVFVLGIAGSFILSRSIRKDTFGLEPYEISILYQERDAVLQSVKEGIVAIDRKGIITTINVSAQELLDLPDHSEGRPVYDIIPSPSFLEIIDSREKIINEELQFGDRNLIVNTRPIRKKDDVIGTVISFRDKTEIKKMIEALSEVRQYTEDLRAQAHEFTSKLYVILGMIQLGKLQEAIAMIQEETQVQQQVTEMFFRNIRDEKVQAIILGKLAKASEKKVDFKMEEGSSLDPLPDHIRLTPLIIILGNLINNAFDAVMDNKEKQVSFFVTDLGRDIVFEIADNGRGLKKGTEQHIFQKGFSLKGDNRGYGLANVRDEVELLHGTIEIDSHEHEGTIFTVILPKKIE